MKAKLFFFIFFLTACLQSACGQATGRDLHLAVYESSAAETEAPGGREAAAGSSSSTKTEPVGLAGQDRENAGPNAGLGTLRVENGFMLERDIVPQLMHIFSLSRESVLAALEASAFSSPLMNQDLHDFRRMEGLIPSGRYDIAAGTSLEAFLGSLVRASEDLWQNLSHSLPALNSLTAAEQFVLASIIAAEALDNRYQDEIARVFLHRLADGQQLQSCVTAEYAAGLQRPFITFAEMQLDSPYNTYVAPALPPGPICSFDEKALRAAMQPAVEDGLYFFYYDYLKNDMFFFRDYAAFQEEAALAQQAFEVAPPLLPFAEINKQEFVKNLPQH